VTDDPNDAWPIPVHRSGLQLWRAGDPWPTSAVSRRGRGQDLSATSARPTSGGELSTRRHSSCYKSDPTGADRDGWPVSSRHTEIRATPMTTAPEPLASNGYTVVSIGADRSTPRQSAGAGRRRRRTWSLVLDTLSWLKRATQDAVSFYDAAKNRPSTRSGTGRHRAHRASLVIHDEFQRYRSHGHSAR